MLGLMLMALQERDGHRRKSKSGCGDEGIQQIPKQKHVSRYYSYIGGNTTRDDDYINMSSAEPPSCTAASGTPMRILLAQEMSKEVKTKNGPLTAIARLMGLRRKKILVEQQSDDEEDLEASHVINRHCSSTSVLTESEMALIQHKLFIHDAKHLSKDNKMLQDSKRLDHALQMLDCCNQEDIFKYLQHLHLHDRFGDPGIRHGSRAPAFRLPTSANCDGNRKAWNSKRNTFHKHDATSHMKPKDRGLLVDSDNRNIPHNPHNLSKIRLKEEENRLPTRISVLKPSLEQMKNAGVSCSFPDLSHGVGKIKNDMEYPRIVGSVTVPWQDLSDSVGFSKLKSKEAREIAKKITKMMREGCNETLDAGDESSFDSDIESEISNLWFGKYRDHTLRRYPSCSLDDESTVNREAKQRLSERWKMTQKYQDVEMVGNGSTLGDMLKLPDRETRAKQLNGKTSLVRANDKHSNDIQCGTVGISSSDGWKDKASETSGRSRSKSLPPSLSQRSHRSSTHHDESAEDKHVSCNKSTYRARSKVVKEDHSHKEDFSVKDSKSRGKKALPYQDIFTTVTDSLSATKMEANNKGLSDELPVFQLAAKDGTCGSPVTMMVELASTSSSSKSFELLPNESFLVAGDDKSESQDQEYSSLQELKKGVAIRGFHLQSLGGDLNSSESREAYHPSPISILEVPFTEDTSSSCDSFERVGAELHELRMQLQLLKLEAGTSDDADAFSLVSIDDEVTQLPPIVSVSGRNHKSKTEHWETYYALDVLIDSGLDDSWFDIFKTTWYSPDCPLDPELFNHLEKLYSDQTTGLRSERRLLFDRINLAVMEIFQDHVNLYPWVMPKFAGLKTKMQKDGIRAALEKLIGQDYVDAVMCERVIDREMQWSDSKGEIDAIGNEIEKMLIDDMVAEIIYVY